MYIKNNLESINQIKSLLISRIKSNMNKKNHKESIEFLEKIYDEKTFSKLVRSWRKFTNGAEETMFLDFDKFIHNN